LKFLKSGALWGSFRRKNKFFHLKGKEDKVQENAKRNNVKGINIEKKNIILKSKIDAIDKKKQCQKVYWSSMENV
jgi:hypothetical protein